MIQFILYTLIAFCYCALLGTPASLFLASQCTSPKKQLARTKMLGLFVMAPIFGVVIQMYAGASIHAILGLHPRLVVLITALLGGASVSLMVKQATFPRSEIPTILIGLSASLAVAIIAILTNTIDLYHIAFNNYFPVTNGDTFVYLGYIDQLRISGHNVPVINYPAGYKPIIEAAFGGRDAVVAFAAAIADTLHLETHTAFFISLRLAFVVLATGVFGVLLLVTSSIVAASVGLFFATVGNFFLPQVLQQFSSSVMGAVLVLALVFIACWECERKNVNSNDGWSAIFGFTAGVLLLVSPETAVVAAFIAGLWFLVAHVGGGSARVTRSMRNSLIGFILGALPTLQHSVMFVYNQFTVAGGRPGDWIANSAILLQASGLNFTTTVGLGSLTWLDAAGAIVTPLLYLVSISLVFLKGNNFNCLRRSDNAMPVVFFSLISLLVAVVLFAVGSGYAMLKVIDYFSIFPALIFGLAAAVIMKCPNSLLRKRCLVFSLVFLVFFGVLASSKKILIFNRYANAVKGVPKLADLRLSHQPKDVPVVIPDFTGGSLDLFLYINRFSTTKLAFDTSESYRYDPLIQPKVGMPFVRLSAPGYGGNIFADITHKTPWAVGLHLTEYDDAIIVSGAGWLPPDGSSGETMFRWLSSKGEFTVFQAGPLEKRHIRMNIYRGPDLSPENRIEIQINGSVLKTIRPKDLPLQLDLIPGNLKCGANVGAIVIYGPNEGIRQVSVAKLSASRS
ncbi:MAG: hypothetical protein EPN76_14825 [Burkholderiaceae bacterium]|nr:MAG: hypothetical protein EPN76_14825 [Burkholderiaceae bacterium]